VKFQINYSHVGTLSAFKGNPFLIELSHLFAFTWNRIRRVENCKVGQKFFLLA